MQDPVQRSHLGVHRAAMQHLRQHRHYRVQVQPSDHLTVTALGRRERGHQLRQLEVDGGCGLADA